MATKTDGPPPAASDSTGSNRPRLVVELSRRVEGQLRELCGHEELNKTTMVNRAIQLYHLLWDVQQKGGKIYIQEGGSDEIERLRLL